MAPVMATTLVVSRWSPTATGSCPPRTSAHARNMAAARSASAVLSTGPAIPPAGVAPGRPPPRAGGGAPGRPLADRAGPQAVGQRVERVTEMVEQQAEVPARTRRRP